MEKIAILQAMHYEWEDSHNVLQNEKDNSQ